MKRMYMMMALVGVFAAQTWAVELTPTITPDRGDGKTVATFTSGTGTWTIPDGVTNIEVLVVGGGGGAWSDGFQSGSGAGGMYYSASYAVTPGSIGITVGAGATDGTGPSSLFGDQMIAYGGTKGNGYTDGGDQGGYSLDGGTTVVPGNLGMHYSPMDGNWCSGGGAGSAGYKGDAQLGGTGAVCNITGSAVHYAGGGGGPSSYSSSGGTGHNLGGGGSGPENVFALHGFSGLANTGGGGGGGWGGGGGAGGSGVVILAYTSATTYYTVSFDSTGGSLVDSKSVESGKFVAEPTTDPTWLGHTFVEWCSDEALTNAFIFASTAITNDTTLYAKWVTDWVVTFNSNGGSAVSNQFVFPGNTATLPVPAPTQTGYTFVEWCPDSALTNAFIFASTAITADTTLYAKWVLDWVVTFDSNGGSDVAFQYVFPGATATEPDPVPTKDGHTFNGWYGESGLENLFDFGAAITADTTLYAMWAINSYTLTYSAGENGTLEGGSPQAQTVDYGGSGTGVLAKADSGYQFAQWSDGKMANPRIDSNVASHINVTASFELLPPPVTPDSEVLRGDGKTVATFSTVGKGRWTIPGGVTEVEVLVVGGGGGAGAQASGAGAGGLYYTSCYSVVATRVVNVTVGAGGAGGPMDWQPGTHGSNSVFGTIIAFGGKATNGDREVDNMAFTSGGSQGGYSIDGGVTTIPGTPGFTLNNPVFDGTYFSGSGAGAAGTHANNAVGGIGVTNAITGEVPAPYYAGGGGALESASGSLGGGGKGGNGWGNPGEAGTPNTGGGGGGGHGGDGGAGGSGVVIVAYKIHAGTVIMLY